MTTILLLAAPALASETSSPWSDIVDPAPPAFEPWEDGITERAPRGLHATVSGVGVGGADLGFGDVRLGYGTDPGDEEAGFGATVNLSALRVAGANEPLTIREVGADLWGTIRSGRSLHGVSVGWHQPPTGADRVGWFRFHPTEAGQRLLLRYDGAFDLGQVDLAVETRGGFASIYGVELTAATAVIVEATDRVAVSAGATFGFSPYGTALVGVHTRPVDHLEIGLVAGSAFPIFRALTSFEPQVGLQLKGWFAGG